MEKSETKEQNIARGTTGPDINSVTRTKFGDNMAPLALVVNLATRWCRLHLLQIWSPYQLSLHKVLESVTSGPKDWTPGLPGSDKNGKADKAQLIL